MQRIGDFSVTIAICVRDGERYISEAIDSAKIQSTEPFEILIIDDGSCDNTVGIALSKDCRVIRQDPKGLASARNSAFLHATTPLIYFLDADDIMPKDSLTNLIDEVESSPSAIGITGFRQNFISPELKDTLHLVNTTFLQREKSFLPSGSLWRRTLKDILTFNETSIIADLEWILDLRTTGLLVAEIEATVLHRRIHLNNSSSKPETRKAYLDLAIRNMKRG